MSIILTQQRLQHVKFNGIFAELGIELDKNIAECIYTGILTDTGAFRYNIQTETFEFVAMLVETGIDIANIYRKMFDVMTEKRVRLLGRALNTLEMYENGKIAITHVTKKIQMNQKVKMATKKIS